jgi:imidazolonepropionase
MVGRRSELTEDRLSGREIVDAGRRVALPGFVDAHTHPVFPEIRLDDYELRSTGVSYEQIAALGDGIRSTVRKTRENSEEQLTEIARKRSRWFLRSGTTTVEAKSGYGLSLEEELKLLRVIRTLAYTSPLRYVPIFLGAHEVPDEYRSEPRAYVDLIVREMIPMVAGQKLAEYCDVFCDPGIFDVAISRKILSAARDAGLGIRIHADQLSRSGGAELAAELGRRRPITWSTSTLRQCPSWPSDTSSLCCFRFRRTRWVRSDTHRHAR